MALGADRPAILRLIVGRGMTLAAAGVALGAVAAHWAGILLSSTVYGVTAIPLADSGSPTAALAGVATLLVVVALAACYLPARRAAAIDPVASLRQGG
jgi:ABC-type antimicrobial peptide transport system permease subunit